MRVETYRNLTNESLSVRRVGGRVFTRPQIAQLTDVTFAVQPAGRERVLREKQKNVHAFVRGEFVVEPQPFDPRDYRVARYNPYESDSFIDKETGAPVTQARVAFVTTKGVYYK